MRDLDQGHDGSGRTLHAIASSYVLPGYVKAAARADLVGGSDDARLYADPGQKLYPTHTAAATVLSRAYFHEKGDVLPPEKRASVDRALVAAARYFGVSRDLEAVDLRAAELRTPAKAARYAAEGGFLPIDTPDQVAKAAMYLAEHRASFAPADRRKIAGAVLDRAGELGLDFGAAWHPLGRMAGRGECTAKQAADLIATRAALLGHSAGARALSGAIAALEANPTSIKSAAVRDRLADSLDDLDRSGYYDPAGLPRPEDVLYAVDPKRAAETLASVVLSPGGRAYERAALGALPLNALADAIGAEKAAACSRSGVLVDADLAASLLPTLSRALGARFEDMAKAAGVLPVASDSSESRRRWNVQESELREWAEAV